MRLIPTFCSSPLRQCRPQGRVEDETEGARHLGLVSEVDDVDVQGSRVLVSDIFSVLTASDSDMSALDAMVAPPYSPCLVQEFDDVDIHRGLVPVGDVLWAP